MTDIDNTFYIVRAFSLQVLRLSDVPRQVFSVISSYGEFHGSRQMLADIIGCSLRSVARALDILEENGYIICTRSGGKNSRITSYKPACDESNAEQWALEHAEAVCRMCMINKKSVCQNDTLNEQAVCQNGTLQCAKMAHQCAKMAHQYAKMAHNNNIYKYFPNYTNNNTCAPAIISDKDNISSIVVSAGNATSNRQTDSIAVSAREDIDVLNVSSQCREHSSANNTPVISAEANNNAAAAQADANTAPANSPSAEIYRPGTTNSPGIEKKPLWNDDLDIEHVEEFARRQLDSAKEKGDAEKAAGWQAFLDENRAAAFVNAQVKHLDSDKWPYEDSHGNCYKWWRKKLSGSKYWTRGPQKTNTRKVPTSQTIDSLDDVLAREQNPARPTADDLKWFNNALDGMGDNLW